MTPREFDKYEQRGAYHWEWYAKNEFQYRELVLRTMTYLPKPGTILDVGCGDGLISYLLFKRGFRVFGIDPNVSAIRLARQQIKQRYTRSHPLETLWWKLTNQEQCQALALKGLKLEEGSIYEIDETQRFDYALCHDVIEHLSDPIRMVTKLMAVVKQYAIVTTPNGLYNSPREFDYQFWTPDEFGLLFKGYPTELVEVTKTRICARVSSVIG